MAEIIPPWFSQAQAGIGVVNPLIKQYKPDPQDAASPQQHMPVGPQHRMAHFLPVRPLATLHILKHNPNRVTSRSK